LKLEEEAELSCEWVPGLGDLVAWTADLDDIFTHLDLLSDHANGKASDAVDFAAAFTLLTRSTAGEVGLMLSALGVGEVRAIVLVDSQTEAAFEATDVVFKEVGVLV
jgi:hypothetical protein